MIKKIFITTLSFSYLMISAQTNPRKYAESISSEELKGLLYTYASDYFSGRETGEKGQKIAVDFLRDYYINQEISPAKNTDNFFQKMILKIKDKKVSTENVVSIITGSEIPEEYIIISAHLDHVGKNNEEIFNGADDDGSGTVALLEIAEAFQKSVSDGDGPKRSIVFLHVTGEEKGLLGSKYYTKNPLYPLEKTVANLNVDMIGRIDPKREDKDPNYIYLIGSDRLSKELHVLSEKVNNDYINLKIDYTFNDEKDPNRFYYRSDHYNFAKKNIPIIFYFNGTHNDYHKSTDTPEKINYPLLAKRSKLIFYTAWKLANQKNRIKLNK